MFGKKKEACSCTQSLRKYNLQIRSFPFDWLYGSNFLGRCQILTQQFNRFIEQRDLKDINTFDGGKSNPCKVYYNSYNDITFNHDFPMGESFENSYPTIKEKYDRRIKRLLENIKTSKNILVVFMETPTKGHPLIENNIILEGYDIIQKAFPNTNVDLIYLQNSKTQTTQDVLNKHVYKFILNYKLTQNDAPDYAVDVSKLKCIFTKYKLNLPYTFFLMKKIQKILIGLIPLKQKRFQLRKKYHI